MVDIEVSSANGFDGCLLTVKKEVLIGDSKCCEPDKI